MAFIATVRVGFRVGVRVGVQVGVQVAVRIGLVLTANPGKGSGG